jgi:hypothetical protein
MGTIFQGRIKGQGFYAAGLRAQASYQVIGKIGWSRTVVMQC